MLELNETDFDTRVAHGTWVVDFTAEWCPPCRMLTPLLARAAAAIGPAATFAAVDADANPRLLQRFAIQALPTILVLRDGTPVHTLRGLRDERSLNAELKAAVGDAGLVEEAPSSVGAK